MSGAGNGSADGGSAGLSIVLINQSWFKDELIALGNRVLVVAWPNVAGADVTLPPTSCTLTQFLSLLPEGFIPDCLVYYDNSGPATVVGLEHSPYRTIFFSVDAHHHVDWHRYFGTIFDRTLVAQPDYLPKFIDAGARASWFPLWAPIHVEPKSIRDIPVAFRGNLDPKLNPERVQFFGELGKRVPLDVLTDAYAETFSRSKIVVNQCVKSDLNFRVFESMMCGALLLTPEIANGQEELFKPGEHIIVYRSHDVDDAAQKIQYYLVHEEERARIADAGRAQILKYHTAAARAADLLRVIHETRISARANSLFGAGVAYISSATLCWRAVPEVAASLLRYGAQCLKGIEKRGEECQKELLSTVLVAKFLLESSGQSDRSMELLNHFHQLYPQEYLFTLGYIDTLLGSQNLTEASAVASAMSDRPTEVVGSVPILMSALRENLLRQLADPL